VNVVGVRWKVRRVNVVSLGRRISNEGKKKKKEVNKGGR
jgi:hypothetical protein